MKHKAKDIGSLARKRELHSGKAKATVCFQQTESFLKKKKNGVSLHVKKKRRNQDKVESWSVLLSFPFKDHLLLKKALQK